MGKQGALKLHHHLLGKTSARGSKLMQKRKEGQYTQNGNPASQNKQRMPRQQLGFRHGKCFLAS